MKRWLLALVCLLLLGAAQAATLPDFQQIEGMALVEEEQTGDSCKTYVYQGKLPLRYNFKNLCAAMVDGGFELMGSEMHQWGDYRSECAWFDSDAGVIPLYMVGFTDEPIEACHALLYYEKKSGGVDELTLYCALAADAEEAAPEIALYGESLVPDFGVSTGSAMSLSWTTDNGTNHYYRWLADASAGLNMDDLCAIMEGCGYQLMGLGGIEYDGRMRDAAWFNYVGGELEPTPFALKYINTSVPIPESHAILRWSKLRDGSYELALFCSPELSTGEPQRMPFNFNTPEPKAPVVLPTQAPAAPAKQGSASVAVPDPMIFLDLANYPLGEDHYSSSDHTQAYLRSRSVDDSSFNALLEYVELLQSGQYNFKLVDFSEADYKQHGYFSTYEFRYTGTADVQPIKAGEYEDSYSVYHLQILISRANGHCGLSWYYSGDLEFVDPGVRSQAKATINGQNGGGPITPGARDPLTIPCNICHGDRSCQDCGGDGKIYDYVTGRDSRACTSCNGNKKCRYCNGTGRM